MWGFWYSFTEIMVSCGQFYFWASFPCWYINITFSTLLSSKNSHGTLFHDICCRTMDWSISFFHKEERIVFFLRFWEVTKDATDFINFIEKRKVKNQTFLVSMQVTSRLSNIPPDRGYIGIVCRTFENFYKATHHLFQHITCEKCLEIKSSKKFSPAV